MAKKQKTKREFDWRTYTKPARLLTPGQESAFAEGTLAPLLAWATGDPRSRFEVRAASAALYHRGVSLARIAGDDPYFAELDAADGGAPERVPLPDATAVAALLARLDTVRAELDAGTATSAASTEHRFRVHSIAAGNVGGDLATDALIFVDTDYALGRRKLDGVALLRSEGVAGPGGFANPDLAFVDVRTAGRSLTGSGGLAAVADDVASFGKALTGEHLRRTAAEMTALSAQKARLGLLPADLEVRSVTEALPHLIVAFAGTDPSPAANDAAFVELHDRLAARHYPTHRLHFVHFVEVPEDGDGLALAEGDAMDYRGFKAYRYADR